MRERPILFSGPMVRAILEGRKTQTRRVAKPRVRPSLLDGSWADVYVLDEGNREWLMRDCPYGVPGDRLWVRETWAVRPHSRAVAYRADGECGAWLGDSAGGRLWLRHGGVVAPGVLARGPEWRGQSFGLDYFGGRWKPSIHMPRWASRLTLTITDVRVERLQDVSGEDALAEGVTIERCACEVCVHSVGLCPADATVAIEAFRDLWCGINGRSSWDVNPWVWVVTFAREAPRG